MITLEMIPTNAAAQYSRIAYCLILATNWGCLPNRSDEKQAFSQTRSYLVRFSEILDQAWQVGATIDRFHSAEEAVDAFQRMGLLELKSDSLRLKRDYWGTPYFWQTIRHNTHFEIRVISYGRNKIFENGAGDDLMLRFKTSTDVKSPSVTIIDNRSQYD